MPKAAYIGPTWFLHQTAHDERGWASDVRHCHTQRAQTFHWPALCLWWCRLQVHRLGDFSLSRCPEEVRKSTREREIHHYLLVLCACGCDFSCFWLPFSIDWICLNPTALIPLFAISAVRRSHINRKGWLFTIYLRMGSNTPVSHRMYVWKWE